MEQKTRKKSQLSKVIMVTTIAIVIITIVVMIYKYFEMKAELNKYKNTSNYAELKEELIKYKNKYDEVYSELAETQNKLSEYRKNTTNNSQDTQERQHYIFRRGNYTYSKRCQ